MLVLYTDPHFVAHLSTKCSWRAIVVFNVRRPSFVVRRQQLL